MDELVIVPAGGPILILLDPKWGDLMRKISRVGDRAPLPIQLSWIKMETGWAVSISPALFPRQPDGVMKWVSKEGFSDNLPRFVLELPGEHKPETLDTNHAMLDLQWDGEKGIFGLVRPTAFQVHGIDEEHEGEMAANRADPAPEELADGLGGPAVGAGRAPQLQSVSDVQNPLYNNTTGGMKYDAGKVPLAIVPSEWEEADARVLAFGGKKYKLWNWTLGMPLSESISAAKRHISAFLRGEDNASDSGLSHLAHARTMLGIAMTNLEELGVLVDDRRSAISPDTLRLTPEEIKQKIKDHGK